MRFARDPAQLISRFQPDHLDQWRSNTELNKTPVTHTTSAFIAHSNKPTPVLKPVEVQTQTQHKTANVLKVMGQKFKQKNMNSKYIG